MAGEHHASRADTRVTENRPWWDVRHPGTIHFYVGLCWGSTPLALVHLREVIAANASLGLTVFGLVWIAGHVALVAGVWRLCLIQRAVGWLLFVAAVMQATVAVGGIAVLTVVPEALSMSTFKLFITFPPLLTGALALLSLSARRSDARPPAPQV